MYHQNRIPSAADLHGRSLLVQQKLVIFLAHFPFHGADQNAQHNQMYHRNHAAQRANHAQADSKLLRRNINSYDTIPEHHQLQQKNHYGIEDPQPRLLHKIAQR